MPKQISGRGAKAGNRERGKTGEAYLSNAPGKLQTRRVTEHDRGGFDWGDHLARLDLPASREELVEQARAHGADDEVIEALLHMPQTHYDSLDELRQGLGRQ